MVSLYFSEELKKALQFQAVLVLSPQLSDSCLRMMTLHWPSVISHVHFSVSPIELRWLGGALGVEEVGELWDGLDELEDELQEVDEEELQQEEQQQDWAERADEELGEEAGV